MVGRRDLMDQAVRYVNTEQKLARLKRDTDPDILGGYDVKISRWWYVMAWIAILGTNMCPILCRVPASVRGKQVGKAGGGGYGQPSTGLITSQR